MFADNIKERGDIRGQMRDIAAMKAQLSTMEQELCYNISVALAELLANNGIVPNVRVGHAMYRGREYEGTFMGVGRNNLARGIERAAYAEVDILFKNGNSVITKIPLYLCDKLEVLNGTGSTLPE